MSDLNGSARVAGSDILFEFDLTSDEIDLTDCVVIFRLSLPGSSSVITQKTPTSTWITRSVDTANLQTINVAIPKTVTAGRRGTVKYEIGLEVQGRAIEDTGYRGVFVLLPRLGTASNPNPIPNPDTFSWIPPNALPATSSTLVVSPSGQISYGAINSYTDEEAQNAVGAILTESNSIALNYNATDDTISAVAIFGTTEGTITEGNDPRFAAIATLQSALEGKLDAPLTLTEDDIPNLDASKITSGTIADVRIPSSIARDSEIVAAIAAFRAEADPLQVYQKEAEKGAANGYPSLDSSALIPADQLGSNFTLIDPALRPFAFLNANRQYVDRRNVRLPELPGIPTVNAGEVVLQAGNESGFTVLNYYGQSNLTFRLGSDLFRIVRNASGSRLLKGEIVYINGSHSGSGVIPTVGRASATYQATGLTVPAIGAVLADFDDNTNGIILTYGKLDGINTAVAGAVDNSVALLGKTPGTFQVTTPILPDETQRIGVIVRAHTNGTLFVNPVSVITRDSGTNKNLWSFGDATATPKTLRALIGGFNYDLVFSGITANQQVAFPPKSGTVAFTDDFHPGFTSQHYYWSPHIVAIGNNATIAGVLAGNYFYVPKTTSFDRLGINVTTASIATGRARLGIYQVNSAGRLTNLMADSGEVAIDTTGTKEAVISVSLASGWYALVSLISQAASFSCSSTNGIAGSFFGTPSPPNSIFTGFRGNQTYGALPAVAPAVAAIPLNNPVVSIRAA